MLVIGGDASVGLLAAELPGQLAPEGAHDRAVGLRDGVAGRDLVADEDDAAHGG